MNIDDWIRKNCKDSDGENKYINGINFKFFTMNDGWIAVLEVTEGGLLPVIQARDLDHAESYCSMIERVNIPLEKL